MYRDSEQSHDHAESGAAVLPVEVCPAENEAAWGKPLHSGAVYITISSSLFRFSFLILILISIFYLVWID